jgi:hypothetical protein
VRCEDLKPEQVARLCADLAGHARYLNRLCARMERLGFPVSDPLYARAISGRNTAEALLSCAGDIGKPRVTPPDTTVAPQWRKAMDLPRSDADHV